MAKKVGRLYSIRKGVRGHPKHPDYPGEYTQSEGARIIDRLEEETGDHYILRLERK